MNVKQRLLEDGFARVVALDAAEASVPDVNGTLLLAFWPYQAEREPDVAGAWIHPYYDASQKAYQAAKQAVSDAKQAGVPLELRDDIRVKPIFARMPGYTQGRNTLTYAPDYGSRFHVQIILLDERMEPDMHLAQQPHPLHCGDCTRCMDACPTRAIDEQGYHRERCLRNWQLTGAPVPEELRSAMGNRLLGCDECQRCCPHNPAPQGEAVAPVSLSVLLDRTKESCGALRERIGTNLAIPNRVLAQVCLLAGNSGDELLADSLRALTQHPSPLVREHAAWAVGAAEKQE